MFSVICVVLVIVGNVNSDRDLEQAILDFYGPPMPPRIMPDDHHPPHHRPLLKPEHRGLRDDVEDIKIDIPQGVLDNIFGPPLKTSNPDADPPVPHFHSAIMGLKQNTKLKEEKDPPNPDNKNIKEVKELQISQADVANLFGTPPPPSVPETPEATAATENSTATNKTGLNVDDRFLPASQLINQWNSNQENSDTQGIVKHVEEPRVLLESAPKSQKTDESESLGPGKERGVLEPGPFEHGKETVPVDPKSLEPAPVDSKPLDPRHLEPKPLDPKHVDPRYLETRLLNLPLDSGHLEPKNQTSTRTSSPNASSKILISNSLFLVLAYFCLESLVLI